MEDALLVGKKEEKVGVITWGSLVEELKKVTCMAAPMVTVTVSEYLLQVVSVMMVGHLGELSLSGVAIVTSLTDVTGFFLLFGFAGALETLCGQAYGAKQYQKLGTYTYSAMITLIPMCVPSSLLWIFMDKLLILIGQDSQVSMVDGRYSIWLIPALFGYAILQSLVLYFQSQSMALPMVFSSCATLCFHVPVCWALVFQSGLGNVGAALAISLSYWFNVILLGVYMRYSSSCEKTCTLIFKDITSSIKEFFRFGVPSAVMICLEWWSFELVILLSGILPNSKLETSVISICLTTSCLHYFIPYSIGAAARFDLYSYSKDHKNGLNFHSVTSMYVYILKYSQIICSTRVSNELGAGNPDAARGAIIVAMILEIAEAFIAGITLFCCRHVLGYVYSNDKDVVDYVAELAPLLSLLIIVDSSQAVLSGVARGSGWQNIGAYVNLGAYYLVGLPVGIVLGFVLHLRGKGLLIGILSGSAVQGVVLALLAYFTNWEKQVPTFCLFDSPRILFWVALVAVVHCSLKSFHFCVIKIESKQ
ncbi:LOW QUALITY PROTEIN: MatE domain-containing protein [Cephalotus follicularis]|uniref:Protein DETOXIFICATION n=1 Tax=Cephalotus follicularis TaxID=3775 RepID=A0A1Q3C6W8_CEPFO|nr:LOW QUALITY PROTEIN: MatE domain-containing protein [Cephalotus follicularis]